MLLDLLALGEQQLFPEQDLFRAVGGAKPQLPRCVPASAEVEQRLLPNAVSDPDVAHQPMGLSRDPGPVAVGLGGLDEPAPPPLVFASRLPGESIRGQGFSIESWPYTATFGFCELSDKPS